MRMTQTPNGVLVVLRGKNISLGYSTCRESRETSTGLFMGIWKVFRGCVVNSSYLDNLAVQISGWTNALPDMVISHLFGKVMFL